MAAVWLSPVYIIFCIYLLRRLLLWLEFLHPAFQSLPLRVVLLLAYSFLLVSLVSAMLMPSSQFQRMVKRISNYWLGIFLYAMLVAAMADALRLILKHTGFVFLARLFTRTGFLAGGGACILLVAGMVAAGIASAHYLRTTEYEITIDKEAGGRKDLQIVLLADLHLGYSIGIKVMERMAERVNSLHPDLIVLAGDIFDNEYEALEDPRRLAEILAGMCSTYGTYACYGNHDIQEKVLAGFTFGEKSAKKSDPRMDAFLREANIRLLRDEAVLIDDAFYVCGRADRTCPGRGIEVRKTPAELMEGLDQDKPIIVIDHQPKELQELADAGVDLDLCGHTHDGQIFPGNLLIRLMWENPYGYLKKGNMHNIVTSGVGVFGPYMRLGTKSEVCSIKVHIL